MKQRVLGIHAHKRCATPGLEDSKTAQIPPGYRFSWLFFNTGSTIHSFQKEIMNVARFFLSPLKRFIFTVGDGLHKVCEMKNGVITTFLQNNDSA